MYAKINLIKSKLALRGIFQNKEVAQLTGLTEHTIGRVFKGELVNRSTAMNIARLLDCPVEELFDSAPKARALTPTMAIA